jgi:RNA-directed DNA polymerase
VVVRLNRKIEGWANYFCLGQVSKAYELLDAHAVIRLRRWLRTKPRARGAERLRYLHESGS